MLVTLIFLIILTQCATQTTNTTLTTEKPTPRPVINDTNATTTPSNSPNLIQRKISGGGGLLNGLLGGLTSGSGGLNLLAGSSSGQSISSKFPQQLTSPQQSLRTQRSPNVQQSAYAQQSISPQKSPYSQQSAYVRQSAHPSRGVHSKRLPITYFPLGGKRCKFVADTIFCMDFQGHFYRVTPRSSMIPELTQYFVKTRKNPLQRATVFKVLLMLLKKKKASDKKQKEKQEADDTEDITAKLKGLKDGPAKLKIGKALQKGQEIMKEMEGFPELQELLAGLDEPKLPQTPEFDLRDNSNAEIAAAEMVPGLISRRSHPIQDNFFDRHNKFFTYDGFNFEDESTKSEHGRQNREHGYETQTKFLKSVNHNKRIDNGGRRSEKCDWNKLDSCDECGFAKPVEYKDLCDHLNDVGDIDDVKLNDSKN